MNLKIFISVVFMLFIRLTGFSQTYIGPTIGYSLSEIVETQNALHYGDPAGDLKLNKEGYIRKSFVFGFRVEKSIFTRFNLSLAADYRQQKLIDDNGRPLELKYNIFSSSLLLNAKVYRSFTIGIGAIFNNNHNYNFVNSHIKNENFIGYALSGTYGYKNMRIGISYKSLKNIDKDNQYYYRMILSSKSFEFSASYMFQL